MPRDNMYILFLLCAIVTLGLITTITLTLFCSRNSYPTTKQHTSPRAIMNLLDPKLSIHNLLSSRFLANQRLLHTFNLSNTFVSPDLRTHHMFVGRMKDLIRAQSRHGHWGAFLHVARQAVESELDHCAKGRETPPSRSFAELVQIVTFKTILIGLLDPDRDMETIDTEDVRVSATLITKLWAMSKMKKSGSVPSAAPPSDDTSTTPIIDELATLNHHLRQLLPDLDKYPNPVDFIIPTWETLWRLVATSLAHVYDQEEYRRSFQELLENPTPERFSTAQVTPRTCWIINETLRLHPPSRHISRSFSIEQHPLRQFLHGLLPKFTRDIFSLDRCPIRSEVAAIEVVHLSTEIWGTDALKFNPKRWGEYTGSANVPTLFAFGYGPLMCIGKNWAPMAAALIVGAILEGVKEGGLEIHGTTVIGGRSDWVGWCVQD
ncbi:hypothetical protein FB446DRAFT_660264, partial [Lentinula raphanica]